MSPRETSKAGPAGGRVFYDSACSFCTGLVQRFAPALERAGYAFEPLQSEGAAATLRIDRDALLDEMRVLTNRGEIHGGADAVIHLARHFWWGRPLAALARLPGLRRIAHSLYREVARRRSCTGGVCSAERKPS